MSATASEKVETNTTAKSEGAAGSLVIVDLGKQKRKDIKALKEGTGDLLNEVRETLAELKSNGAISSNAEPVVLVVREKLPKPKLWF
jgi:hypothetical protein